MRPCDMNAQNQTSPTSQYLRKTARHHQRLYAKMTVYFLSRHSARLVRDEGELRRLALWKS